MGSHDIIPSTLPSNLSRDARETARRDAKKIYSICDDRLSYVIDMIKSSQSYLKVDKEREDALKKEE